MLPSPLFLLFEAGNFISSTENHGGLGLGGHTDNGGGEIGYKYIVLRPENLKPRKSPTNLRRRHFGVRIRNYENFKTFNISNESEKLKRTTITCTPTDRPTRPLPRLREGANRQRRRRRSSVVCWSKVDGRRTSRDSQVDRRAGKALAPAGRHRTPRPPPGGVRGTRRRAGMPPRSGRSGEVPAGRYR